MGLASRVHHECEITCTETEIAAKGKELAGMLAQHDELEEDKKETVRTFKTQLDELGEDIRNLAKVVATGVEMRPIECSERFNLKRASIETYRMDSGEVITNRPMTPEEARQARQGDLTFDLIEGGKGEDAEALVVDEPTP